MTLPNLEKIDTPNGSFLTFPTDMVIPRALRKEGGFESHLAVIATEMHRLHPGRRPGLLVDVGANIGTFCVPVARATGCSVIAFEAQRIISQILGANLVINGVEHGWVRNVVLGAPGHPAFMQLPMVDYSQQGNFGAYAVDRTLFGSQSLSRMRIQELTEAVAVCTLDDCGLENVFLVKLDVEGFELDVLKGAVRTLERNRFPPLVFETWRDDWWREKREALISFVTQLGYDVTIINENYFAQHRSSTARLELTVVTGP